MAANIKSIYIYDLPKLSKLRCHGMNLAKYEFSWSKIGIGVVESGQRIINA